MLSPYGLEFDQLDAWSAAAGLAEATERIEIIAAIKPLYVHPAILAKLALGIDAISRGRFAINVVSGWFLPELTRTGLPHLEHDERYAYSAEWIDVVRPLLEGELVDHDGRHLRVHDLQLRPGPVTGTRPHIYIGGESGPGRDLGARHADTFLMNGRPLDEAMTIPTWNRTRAEFLAPLQDDGPLAQAWHVEEHDLLALPDTLLEAYERTGDVQAFADAVAEFFTAAFLPSLWSALDGARDPADVTALTSAFESRLKARIAAVPRAVETHWHVVLLRLTRRERD